MTKNSEEILKRIDEIKDKIANNEILSEEETSLIYSLRDVKDADHLRSIIDKAESAKEKLPPDDSSPVDKAHANDSTIIETTIPGLSISKAAIMRDRLLAGEPFTEVEVELLKSILICISEGEVINPIVTGSFDIYPDRHSIIKVADMAGIQYFKAACETTSNKEITSVERLIALKQRMYLAEHSPIRMRQFWIHLANIPTFVATHLVRHHVGIDHYQLSHRFDRTHVPNEESNRMTPTNISMHLNAQALINMARKRLCSKASPETRLVMEVIKEAIRVLDPDLAEVMVTECVYRHMCPEEKSCGYIDRLLAEVNKRESEAAEKGESELNVESECGGKDEKDGQG
ncbi:MAG: FAD-dependent thymidylate synthase [Pseudobutyrivibrio sp.]|nr:FAD-dependent thymidylate synthase [Pseudobutyrivibrio sp.]